MKENQTNGHILMIGTLIITLIIPLALILLSFVGIISGLAQYIAAVAVIMATIYIVAGSIWMFVQDYNDRETMT